MFGISNNTLSFVLNNSTMTKSGFISQVAHMAVERKVNKARNITDFMNRYWPEGWTSAAESPKKSGEYLVVYEGPHKVVVITAYFYTSDGWDRYKHNDYHVTRWQPLPPAPSTNQ